MTGSDDSITDGEAVFKVSGERGNDANSTHTLLPRLVAQARRLRLLSWCVTVVVVSDDPAFLAAFAEAGDSGRLMVWETRLLVVTRLAKTQLSWLMQDYWTFSMMNTMFLISIPEYDDERCQLYAHLPYTPQGARVVLVASWSIRHGWTYVNRHTAFPEKYKNFHGMSINVSWFPLQPYFTETRDKTSQVPRYAGRGYTILAELAGALNFSINFLPFQGQEYVMPRISQRQAYIRPIKVAFLQHFIERYDFTMFIERATMGFLMAKPTLKPSWQSLYHPLQPAVWGSTAATVLLVFIVLMLMNRRSEGKSAGAWLVVKQVVGTLLDEAIHGELPRRSPTRVVLTAWLIFAFIVGTVYRSNLTASLTAPKYPPRPETLTELVDTGVKKAFMFERLSMKAMVTEKFTNKRGSTPLYVARENILPGYCGWPLTPNTPFKASLDHYILAFHGAGLIERWTTEVLQKAQFDTQRRLWKEADGSDEFLNEQDASNRNILMALSLVHMQGPLFLYFAGAFLSLAVFCSENAASF
ncbi:uncharacterized protein LOC127007033 isoform X4 [Eriocheir sinensis]|nr:uncharacterized protein LOC127007033 isoform X4 [Eriocheir sinensis]XP_050733483.1 uncharacterized protein LOC127007033 isoform X4 [Eriocheir sinensis]XP_050733484.1 uncharacterized protein LOC127007033 isoform X4 [Eriocheir sinensis]XP_050733485.1 uncharacterized protein LOC127007033 isoform X4 [Eriocheir sinensis]XP_050733486.1 uncharacterized protein LOC127007033 isoform X4 [Eriocheir sinensis]